MTAFAALHRCPDTRVGDICGPTNLPLRGKFRQLRMQHSLASEARVQAQAELYFAKSGATIRVLQSLLEVIYV